MRSIIRGIVGAHMRGWRRMLGVDAPVSGQASFSGLGTGELAISVA